MKGSPKFMHTKELCAIRNYMFCKRICLQLSAEPWFRRLVAGLLWQGAGSFPAKPYGIYGGQNDTETGLSPSTSGFPYQCHSIHIPAFIYHHFPTVLATDSFITYHTYFVLIFGSDLHFGLRLRQEQENRVLVHTTTYKTLKTRIKCILPSYCTPSIHEIRERI